MNDDGVDDDGCGVIIIKARPMGRRMKEKLRSSKVKPSGGPRGRRGACGSCYR